MFACIPYPTARKFNLVLVRPFEIAPRVEGDQRDHQLGYLRLRPCTDTPSQFIFLDSIIRGAVLIPTNDTKDHLLVFDLLDDDSFLRYRKTYPGRTEGQPIGDADLTLKQCDGPDLEEILRNLERAPARGRQRKDGEPLSPPRVSDFFMPDSDTDVEREQEFGGNMSDGYEEFDFDAIIYSDDDN